MRSSRGGAGSAHSRAHGSGVTRTNRNGTPRLRWCRRQKAPTHTPDRYTTRDRGTAPRTATRATSLGIVVHKRVFGLLLGQCIVTLVAAFPWVHGTHLYAMNANVMICKFKVQEGTMSFHCRWHATGDSKP